MFIRAGILENARRIVFGITIFLGCITLLACESSAGVPENSEVRAELLRALKLQKSVAESLELTKLAATLEKTIQNVQYAGDDELEPVANAIGEFKNYGDSLERLDSSIQKVIADAADQSFVAPSPITSTDTSSVSLTPPAYFDGGVLKSHCRIPVDASKGQRYDTEAMINAKIAVGVAKTAWAGVEVACGLDAVALASGGLGTVACAAAAVAVAGAEEVVDAMLRCDATVDEAHLDAAFKRAENNFILGTHIHDNLDTHDTDIKELLSEIAANQREIIKLLKTPQGQRPGWNMEGY